jgi:hypothetical protein
MTWAEPEATVAAASARRPGESRLAAAYVDASDAESVARLAREHAITHVFNAVDPRFVMSIFAGARAAGANYLDMAMSLSRPHETRPHELTGVKLGDEQFAQAGEWEAEGRLALVGIGVEPGLSDVFARYAADHLFSDDRRARHPRRCQPRHPRRDRATRSSRRASRCGRSSRSASTRRWCGRRTVAGSPFTLPPFSEPEIFDFPEGIGPVECVHVEHEEVLLMPRWVDAKKVTFKYGLGERDDHHPAHLHTLGLDKHRSGLGQGGEVSPARRRRRRCCPTQRPSGRG